MLKETFRLASRTEGSATARLIDAVIRERPDLAHETFYVPGKGKSSCAVLTEKEVFKVIQTVDEDGMPLYDTGLESQLQAYLYSKGLALPEVTCIDSQGEFFGMKRSEGTRLSLLDISRREALEDINYQVGKFIAEIETASLSRDFDHIRHTMVQTSENSVAVQAAGLLKSRKLRQAVDNPALLSLLKDQADKMLKAPSVLIHDDLHESNILLKPNGKCAFLDMGCAHLAHSVYTEIGIDWKENHEAILKGYVENQTRRTEADLICEHLLHEMVLNSKNNLLTWCRKDMPAMVEKLQKLGALPKASEQKPPRPKTHPRPKR
jgi:tRNA A-37 threonylcarbamoyl transferase component Bud32